MRKLLYIVVCVLLLPTALWASNPDSVYADTAVYRGMSIKLDLLNSALEPIRSKGRIQSYEIAMNWRIINRLFPTLELGYSNAQLEADGAWLRSQGGFARVGMDFSPMKKHPEYNDLLLVGLRVGTAVEQHKVWDAWGEILAGCQVQVYKGLEMGWYIRRKILFTRKHKDAILPTYIPGFGTRDDGAWGFNYYIGYRF